MLMALERCVPKVFTGVLWLCMVKPFQIKPCELLQPHVPTLTGVGGALATSWKSNSQSVRAQSHNIFLEFLLHLAWCHLGPMRIKRDKCNPINSFGRNKNITTKQ